MAIFLLECVTTYSGTFYFWRNYFFTLLQSNYFDTTINFSKQLFFRAATFFEELPFSEQSPLRSSHFFRIATFFPFIHFLEIGCSLEQVLFGTPTLMLMKLFRIKSFSQEVLIRTRYFCAASTFSEELLFGKSQLFRKAIFCINYFS